MSRGRAVAVALYTLGYIAAVWAAIDAANSGHNGDAAACLLTSIALLVGLHREHEHTALLLHVICAYQHGQPLPSELARIQCTTAAPPGCTCELWWTSLGAEHDPCCATTRKARP